MDKRQALEEIHAAKTAHIQWRARAQALVAGIPVNQEQIPVIHTDCKFGKWYYGPGQALNFLPSYRAVEEPHEQLHSVYMKIFTLLFGEDHRSVLSSVFGSKRKREAEKHEQAEKHLAHLVGISHTLLETVEMLEHDVQRLPESKPS
jgi:hypothetical protein